jgi:hypothetical protein
MIPDSHNFDIPIAARTKNRVAAIHNTETINFHKLIVNHHTSILINHHNISCFAVSMLSKFSPEIIVTKTVEILIAKQIIAGAKIIGSKFSTFKYLKTQFFIKSLSSILKAFNNIIIGDNAIAIHKIHILIINNIATAINGIHIAKTWHTDKATLNNEVKIHHHEGITHLHEFNKDEYKAVKIHTYDFHSIISCSLLVCQPSHVHLL